MGLRSKAFISSHIAVVSGNFGMQGRGHMLCCFLGWDSSWGLPCPELCLETADLDHNDDNVLSFISTMYMQHVDLCASFLVLILQCHFSLSYSQYSALLVQRGFDGEAISCNESWERVNIH